MEDDNYVAIHLSVDEANDLLKYLEMSRRRLLCQYTKGVLELIKQMKQELKEVT